MLPRQNGFMTLWSILTYSSSRLRRGIFTWSNHKSEDDSILEKLDRILVSLKWSNSFPRVIGVLDAAIASDHAPIVLLLNGMKKRYRRDFKFEAKWLLEEDCTSKVEESWPSSCGGNNFKGFGRKLNKTRVKLR
ncbi:hypothetical protein V6N11_076445 [Hibiscus sabdariffa]|uniref:Uncharacterized protein n=1 Tax=Hibiscus sabdariffa TaxID=183260 RepID=A0ABR2Q6A2_9ROSI